MSFDFQPSGRVAVTGLGVVSPIGVGLQDSWSNLIAGKNGVGNITLMDVSDYATKFAAEVKNFEATDWVDRKEARRLDRVLIFSLAAAKMALDHSGLPIEDEQLAEETGVLVGSGIGGLMTLSEQAQKLFEGGPSRVSPFLVPYMIPDMCSGYVSIRHKLKGPNTCVVTACATGTMSIGDAYHMIKRGDARAMLAGGAEAPIAPVGMAGFCAAKAMSTRNDSPETASRPFDAEREGFVMGEGAAVLILEDYEFAKERGAEIYAEIIGYSMAGDAYHITAPDPEGDGAYRAMKLALRSAGLNPEDVDYINAHGTSTQMNDRLETAAIKRVFGEQAYKTPVSSTKSSVGHLLGAAGAMEAAFCINAMRDGVIPPTINYENPDPDCDLDYVPNTSREADLKVCLSNSFGFGGHNATLVLRKPS